MLIEMKFEWVTVIKPDFSVKRQRSHSFVF